MQTSGKILSPAKWKLQCFCRPRKLECLSPWQKLSSGYVKIWRFLSPWQLSVLQLQTLRYLKPSFPKAWQVSGSLLITPVWDVSWIAFYPSASVLVLCLLSLSHPNLAIFGNSSAPSFSAVKQPTTLPLFAVWPASCHSCFSIDSASYVSSSTLITKSSKKGLLEKNFVLDLVLQYWDMYHRVVSQLSHQVNQTACSCSQGRDQNVFALIFHYQWWIIMMNISLLNLCHLQIRNIQVINVMTTSFLYPWVRLVESYLFYKVDISSSCT